MPAASPEIDEAEVPAPSGDVVSVKAKAFVFAYSLFLNVYYSGQQIYLKQIFVNFVDRQSEIRNMSLKVCVLASGSTGNCAYLASGQARILIDAGLSCQETGRRLESINADLAQVDAICITHEHDDHTASLGVLHRRVGMALYANAGAIQAIEQNRKLRDLPWNVFTTGASFQIGDLRIEPFSVPHDGYDPVGFVVSSGNSLTGIVTDMGMATALIRERLRNCQTVIVECNHDEQLLRNSPRPWTLKQRIGSRQGHLSNDQAGELIADIAGPELKVVFLAHLSSDCNRPDLAVKTVQQALANSDRRDVSVKLTYSDRASDVVLS